MVLIAILLNNDKEYFIVYFLSTCIKSTYLKVAGFLISWHCHPGKFDQGHSRE